MENQPTPQLPMIERNLGGLDFIPRMPTPEADNFFLAARRTPPPPAAVLPPHAAFQSAHRPPPIPIHIPSHRPMPSSDSVAGWTPVGMFSDGPPPLPVDPSVAPVQRQHSRAQSRHKRMQQHVKDTLERQAAAGNSPRQSIAAVHQSPPKRVKQPSFMVPYYTTPPPSNNSHDDTFHSMGDTSGSRDNTEELMIPRQPSPFRAPSRPTTPGSVISQPMALAPARELARPQAAFMAERRATQWSESTAEIATQQLDSMQEKSQVGGTRFSLTPEQDKAAPRRSRKRRLCWIWTIAIAALLLCAAGGLVAWHFLTNDNDNTTFTPVHSGTPTNDSDTFVFGSRKRSSTGRALSHRGVRRLRG